ncbi:hypothetical protein [Marinimicrococcus flavescens]|uniref:Uncharacterized protein n=1 Tax=Marinimicrococcus flavescens TaxID=3031815 RepID=A0AAP3V2C8_9PROT|nr:hypothetical protein [Marinimicrococcus flavescens]
MTTQVSAESARQGHTLNRMRYVLAASTALAVLSLSIAYAGL